MKVTLVSNMTAANIDDIKLAALYFDHINVIERIHVTDFKYDDQEKSFNVKAYRLFSEEFDNHVQLFEREGVVTRTVTSLPKVNYSHKFNMEDFDHITKGLIQDKADMLFPGLNITRSGDSISFALDENTLFVANSEAEYVYNNYLRNSRHDRQFEDEGGNKLYDLMTYYLSLTQEFMAALSRQEIPATTSENMSEIIRSYFQSKDINERIGQLKADIRQSPSIVMEALRLALPDVSQCSIEDILELRNRARDELQAFRAYMDQINFEVNANNDRFYSIEDAKQIVNAKVRPSLIDLTAKLRTQEYKLAKTFIDQIKDPKTYIPLVGTVLGDVPAHIAILLSISLAGSRAVLEYLEGMHGIKNHGLYYLFTVQKSLGGK